MNDEWPTHNKLSAPASSFLYPDVVGHDISFDEASLNLLSAQDQVDIEACRVDKHGFESESIESYDDLMFYFETSKSCHATSSSWEDMINDSFPSSDQSINDDLDHGAEAGIVFIQQEYFYSPLSVSAEILKCLLARHQVFPQFANLTASFSPEKANFHEGSSGFYASALTRNPGDQSIDELCYILKYAEYDIESNALVPWSTKQMAIYQKADSKTQQSTSIIIRPSAEVWRRKDEMSDDIDACRQLSEHWTGLHMLIISTLNKNWESYLQSLNTAIEKLNTQLHSSSAEDITPKDLQKISRLKDLLLKFIHAQKLNTEVLTMLREESRLPGGREEFDKKDFSCKYRALEWAIESTLSETKMLCSHADLILSRADNIAAMLRDLINIQHNQIMQETNHNTNQALQTLLQNQVKEESFAPEEQKMSPDLEVPSEKESAQQPRSSGSKIVSWTLFLVPLIFTSTFLDVSFRGVEPINDPLAVRESHLWFYVDLALLLLMVGLVVWYVREWRPRRKRVKEEVEVYVKQEEWIL